VQDWSGREHPKSYLKVYIRENSSLIDIYHFVIDPKKKMLTFLLSNEGSIFLSESWKRHERRFTVQTPFSYVFPLKRGLFDGMEVPLPAETEEYLKMRYGKDLRPVRLYSAVTDRYEKDLSHPYWKIADVVR
jgi:hypothetical protein